MATSRNAEAIRLIEENKRKKSPNLNLSGLGLKNLPIELLDCRTWLRNLDLSDNRYLADLDDLSALEELAVLDLSETKVFQFTFLQNLKNLINLNLSGTRVEGLECLKPLGKLQHLDVSSTAVKSIEVLKGLPAIEVLLLNDSEITDFSTIKILENLRQIDVSGNAYISDMNFLRGLRKLEELNISETGVSDAEPLSLSTRLRILVVHHTLINDISVLRNMPKLNFLDISNTMVIDLAPLVNCPSLEHLESASTEVYDLEPLKGLKSLHTLMLASSRIDNLAPLDGLLGLKILDISQTKVKDLSPLKALSSLKDLNISDTSIEDLSPIDFFIHKYDKPEIGNYNFKYNGCLISTPPIEVVNGGLEVMSNYFYEIDKEGVDEGLEAKVIVIGESMAGKTSLCKRIADGAKAELPKFEDRTLGVDVTISPINSVRLNGQTLNLNIYDFGGQDFYKPLHQFFYTNGALYILVLKDGLMPEEVDYWLEAAQVFGEGSPVLVVNNYFGSIPAASKNEIAQHKHGGIVKRIVDVNLSSCDGLGTLFDSIEKLVNDLHIVHTKIPKTWGKLRQDLAMRRNRKVLSIDEFLALSGMERFGKMDEETSRSFLNYIHKIGVCLYYEKVDLLENIIILENEWATKAIYQVMVDNEIKQKKGYFKTEDLKRIWNANKANRILGQEDEKYGRYLFELKHLMEHFKLCYPVHINSQEFVAPILLPSSIEAGTLALNPEDEIAFMLKYDYLPLALFYQFIVECRELIDSDNNSMFVANTEVALRYGSSRALVRKILIDGKVGLLFQIDGKYENDFICLYSEIKRKLNKLHQGLPDLGVKESFPCRCNHCLTLKISERTFFDEDDFEAFSKKGMDDVYCSKSRCFIKVGYVKKNVSANVGEPTCSHVLRTFILFASEDSFFLEEFKKHMTLLVREKLIDLWDEKSRIFAGDEKDKKTKAALASADIVFLLTSANLLARWDIEEELADSFERAKNNEAVIVPIILSDCDWENTKIGSIQVLPRDGRPIKKVGNPDEPWNEINKEVRRLVEEFRKRVNAREPLTSNQG